MQLMEPPKDVSCQLTCPTNFMMDSATEADASGAETKSFHGQSIRRSYSDNLSDNRGTPGMCRERSRWARRLPPKGLRLMGLHDIYNQLYNIQI